MDFVLIFVLCCPVEVQTLRRADSPPSKESYQMSEIIQNISENNTKSEQVKKA
jgi:hypothetical protein